MYTNVIGVQKMPIDIGIDMGTANTVIYAGKTVILSEPSVVAVETNTGRPIKFGAEAYKMIGRTPGKITPVCPIERGVIASYDEAEHLLRYFMRKVYSGKLIKPRVMFSMPAGTTAVQQRSFMSAVQASGARNICPIESPVAAAIGVGVDFAKPCGSIVVDIGAGSTDIAVLSMGGIAQYESLRIASSDFDEAIIRYIRKEHNVLVGRQTAENIKKQIGCVIRRPLEITMKAKGRNLFTGLPQVFEITANEICDAVSEVSQGICAAVQSVIEKTPPELVGDIARDGLTLTGGGSLIHGMAELMGKSIGIEAAVAEEPMSCVAYGIGKALKNFDILKNGDYEFRSLQDLIID